MTDKDTREYELMEEQNKCLKEIANELHYLRRETQRLGEEMGRIRRLIR